MHTAFVGIHALKLVLLADTQPHYGTYNEKHHQTGTEHPSENNHGAEQLDA